MSENKSYIQVKKYTQKQKGNSMFIQHLPLVFKQSMTKQPLLPYKGVNTSAEWIKKGQKNLVKDMSRAAGSVSSTKAEWQYGGQRNYYCHQPVIDIQSPAQPSCPNMQFTLESMAIT